MNPERAMAVWAAIWGALGVVAFTMGRGAGSGAAFALGAALGLVNLRWLTWGVHALADAAAGQAVNRPMRAGIIRFAMRFALLAAVVCAILFSRILPIVPLLWGLFAAPAGALAEALRLLLVQR